MNRLYALDVATRAMELLRPFCERIEIAGSVRRLKPEVNDIELCCIPRPRDMFGFAGVVDKWKRERGQSSGRYTRRVFLGASLDLFMCRPETWACNMLIRTGSKDFSHAVATHAWRVGHCFVDAQLWATRGTAEGRELSHVVPVVEEADVFDALGLAWVEPVNRLDATSLRFKMGARQR